MYHQLCKKAFAKEPEIQKKEDGRQCHLRCLYTF